MDDVYVVRDFNDLDSIDYLQMKTKVDGRTVYRMNAVLFFLKLYTILWKGALFFVVILIMFCNPVYSLG